MNLLLKTLPGVANIRLENGVDERH